MPSPNPENHQTEKWSKASNSQASASSGAQNKAGSTPDSEHKRHLPQIKRPHIPRPGFSRLPFRHRPAIKEVMRETTSGGIVFRKNKQSGELEILLIQDAKRRWTIPKGHVEPGEDPGATAEREIREETGLQEMEVFSEIGKVDFRYRRADTLVLMTMHIWMVEGRGDTDKLDPEDWLSGIRWFKAIEAVDKIAYDDIGKLILLAMKKIRKGNY